MYIPIRCPGRYIADGPKAIIIGVQGAFPEVYHELEYDIKSLSWNQLAVFIPYAMIMHPVT